MKKIIVTSGVLFVFAVAHAEEPGPLIDRSLIFDVFNICGILMVMYVIANFILGILQRNLDHRVKNRIIEAGTPESILMHLLPAPDKKKDNRKTILQWICVLLGLGVGLSIIDLTMPFGLHSVAIMVFSIAAGFLAWYLISGRTKKDKQDMSGE